MLTRVEPHPIPRDRSLPMTQKILVVEDEETLAFGVALLLE